MHLKKFSFVTQNLYQTTIRNSSHNNGDSETDIHVQLSQIPCNVHKIRIQILCHFFAKKVHHFNLFLSSCSLQNRSCFLFAFLRRAKASAKLACSAGVFFERAICSRKRHVETSRREEEMGRVKAVRPRTYRKGYYFYSPQSSTVIKSKMTATTILRTRTRFRPPKIRLHCRLARSGRRVRDTHGG